jgi:hypothetical protein
MPPIKAWNCQFCTRRTWHKTFSPRYPGMTSDSVLAHIQGRRLAAPAPVCSTLLVGPSCSGVMAVFFADSLFSFRPFDATEPEDLNFAALFGCAAAVTSALSRSSPPSISRPNSSATSFSFSTFPGATGFFDSGRAASRYWHFAPDRRKNATSKVVSGASPLSRTIPSAGLPRSRR